MKKFILKLAIILILSLMPNLIIGIIRISYGDKNIPFEINKKQSTLIETGPQKPYVPYYITTITDLAPDTINGIKEIRDQFGFSNSRPNKKPKIIFIGDSFFADARITYDSGIQATCDRILGCGLSYNIAGVGYSGFKVYNELIKKQYLFTPRIIICEIVERDLNRWSEFKSQLLFNLTIEKKISNFGFDFILGNNFRKIGYSNVVNNFKFFNTSKHVVFMGSKHLISGKSIYFLKNKITHLRFDEIDNIATNMKFAQEYFHNKNCNIYFLIVPDKESMYPSIFGKSQILEMQNKFSAQGINIIDIYSELSKNPLYYYLDGDTHWSNNAVKKMFDVLVENGVINPNLDQPEPNRRLLAPDFRPG